MLFDGLLVLIVAAHLMAVGLAAGAPAVALWLGRREARRADILAGAAGRWLLRQSQWALLAGAALGAAAVGLLWWRYREPYFAAAGQVRVTRYWFGLVELVFTFACFGAGLSLWKRDATGASPHRRRLRQAIVFLGELNLVYHFPPLFAVIGVLSTRPELEGRNLSYVDLLADSEVLARMLHFLLASLAVTGAGLMVFAARGRADDDAPDRRRAAVWGGRIALGAAALQLLSGLWLLVELPVDVRERLLGQDMAGTGCLALSVVTTVALLHLLAAAAWGDTKPRTAWYAVAGVALIVVLMAAARHRGRKEQFERRRTSRAVEPMRLAGRLHEKRFFSSAAGASTPYGGAVIYYFGPLMTRDWPRNLKLDMEPIVLRDATTGSTAKILSGLGFNCYSFQPQVAGTAVEVLWSEADFEQGKSKASHSGIPILFPFAGRLRGSFLTLGGQNYPLGSDDGLGNAIHGFVLNRPWRIVEHLPQRAVGEFQASVDEPGLLRRWPGDFRLTVTYELAGNSLAATIIAHNPGQGRLPFGLGTHPYFRLPLGAGGTADNCHITVPVAEYWPLTHMVPTGERRAADGPRALAAGMRFADAKLDDVFTGLTAADGRCRATIDDPTNGRRLELVFDDTFRECVVYTPPHREAICIEPYTCVPDAFALEAAGIATGLRWLAPGESFTARMQLTLS